METHLVIILVMFCALLGATGQIFFKLASEHLSLDFDLLRNWQLWLGLSLYGLATILFVYALQFGNLSFAYPIIATSYIWVGLFSWLFLHEQLPASRIFGIMVIIAGVALVAK